MLDKFQEDQDMQLLAKALAVLREHFDTAIIFCTRHDQDESATVACNRQFGNTRAIKGQILEWVQRDAIQVKKLEDDD